MEPTESQRKPRKGLRSLNQPQNRRQNGTKQETPMVKKTNFSPHWSADETARKLELGQCFRGEFRVNVKNLQESFITVSDLPHDVLVRGKQFQNRAMVGDIVAVSILPTNYWWVQKSLLKITDTNTTTTKLDLTGDIYATDDRVRRMAVLRKDLRVCLDQRGKGEVSRIRTSPVWEHATSPEEAKTLIREVLQFFPELKPTAEVVRIMQESPRRHALIGILHSSANSPNLDFLPMEGCLPKKFIVSKESLKPNRNGLILEAAIKEKTSRTLLRAEFLRWEEAEEWPSATIHDILGPTGDLDVETSAILESRGVQDQPFSEEILNSLPDSDWTPGEAEIEGRLDLRSNRVFTIDPPDARDLDDALSIEKLTEKEVKVGVHIADVSHFVKAGSLIDKEAEIRTTSVYLVQRMIPMLPELLSSNLCSLKPGVDRLTFSVIWKMDLETAEILDQTVSKSVVHSCAKLAYQDAQTVIQDPDCGPLSTLFGPHSWEAVKSDILLLFNLSEKLRKGRVANGALRLDQPKILFSLDPAGHPQGIQYNQQMEANHLIEEFMLLANMSIAKLISEVYPTHSLLRNHRPPNSSQLSDLLAIGQELKIEIDISNSAGIQQGLFELKQKLLDEDTFWAITNLATKPMQLAEYFCTGALKEDSWSHFALSVERYTHFTSPIRRYPDIVVHRLTQAAISETLDPSVLNNDAILRVQLTAEACNKGKLSAKNAQEDCESLYLMHWLERCPVQTSAVVVSLKGPEFFEIYVPDFALATRIYCADLPGKTEAHFDRQTNTLLIDRNGGDQFYAPQSSPPVQIQLQPHGDGIRAHFVYSGEVSHDQGCSEGRGLNPLKFPVKLSRFLKVPVKVWARRCVIFGKLMEIRVDLITENLLNSNTARPTGLVLKSS